MDSTLLIQCTTAQADTALSAHGLVITGPRAIGKAAALRPHYRGPVLCDAQLYAGRHRKPAREAFSRDWLRCQPGPVLTDSGYIGKLDARGLSTILHRTMRLGDAIAVLPLHIDWLSDPQDRSILLQEIAFAQVPVALVLEHADPLGLPAVVSGLLAVLAVGVPVILLRAGVSGLGALCHGALAVAVQAPSRYVALAPHFLNYVSLDELAAAVRRTPDLSHLWECECSTCNGRTVDWLVGTPSAAFPHSVEHLGLLRDELLTCDSPPRAWLERCNAAAALHPEIPDWAPPPFLEAWRYSSSSDTIGSNTTP